MDQKNIRTFFAAETKGINKQIVDRQTLFCSKIKETDFF